VSVEFSEPEATYLHTTLDLMTGLGFRVRDTFSFQRNLDDYYTNGKRYDGPRQFKIQWVSTTDFSRVQAKLAYTIPRFASSAYDGYTITVASRLKLLGRDDAIIHECVHFLQHVTAEEESSYVDYNGNNYREYVSQRTELEAHLVQIAYIIEAESKWLEQKLDQGQRARVREMIDRFRKTHNTNVGLTIILICKETGLI